MKIYDIKDVKHLILKICSICQGSQDVFTEADSRLGDGDMGITIGKGAAAVEKVINNSNAESEDLTKLFLDCAMEMNRCAPSTLGTLISFGAMAVGKELDHKSFVEEKDIGALVKVFADTISKRGKAEIGDKTILDALYPYAETLEKCYRESGNMKTALHTAAAAARQGMERTKGMKARTGRASWLDTRNMEYPDAGAVLMVTVGEGIAE